MRRFEKNKVQARQRRHRRVRAKVLGTAERPRLCVFRSLTRVFLQLIDDQKGRTLLGMSSHGLKPSAKNPYKGKSALSYEAGLVLAQKAKEQGIEAICFDRGGYAYHGRVQAAAEGARAGGLKF